MSFQAAQYDNIQQVAIRFFRTHVCSIILIMYVYMHGYYRLKEVLKVPSLRQSYTTWLILSKWGLSSFLQSSTQRLTLTPQSSGLKSAIQYWVISLKHNKSAMDISSPIKCWKLNLNMTYSLPTINLLSLRKCESIVSKLFLKTGNCSSILRSLVLPVFNGWTHCKPHV